MLLLDAAEHAPTLYVVLTAREHLTRRDTYKHLECVLRSVRRRWPDCEWFVQVEFQRRGALHLNLLVKGVPVEARDELLSVLAGRWCARVDAELAGQWCGEISEAGGLAKYLAKHLGHGLKQEQAPPIGWKGHRTSQTRGYLVRPASVMREEARKARRLKRALTRAIEAGHQGHDAELVAHEAIAIADETTWELVHLPTPRQELVDDERKRMAPVPWFVLEAAFKWAENAREGGFASESVTTVPGGWTDLTTDPHRSALEAGKAPGTQRRTGSRTPGPCRQPHAPAR
jgi:hypothetical protein